MGGDFCSATKFKCVPLPLYSRHTTTPNSLKTVSLHAQRYTPAPNNTSHHHNTTTAPPLLVSYSMLSMPVKAPSSRQRHHHVEREVAMGKARSLQRAREVVPHRLHWGFFMNGQSAELADREAITSEELRLLQHLTFSQNPALYYGSGIKSGSGEQLKEVARFERRVVEALRRRGRESNQDLGRFSRLSRTLTPGSPIMELDEPLEPPSPQLPLHETFLTDPPHSEHIPPL